MRDLLTQMATDLAAVSYPWRHMSDEITPALSAEEWAVEEKHNGDRETLLIESAASDGAPMLVIWHTQAGVLVGTRDLVGAIALANHALPDTDPRKITRDMVERLARCIDGESDYYRLGPLHAALASLLPSEGA